MENADSIYPVIEIVIGYAIIAASALLIYCTIWYILVHFYLLPLTKTDVNEKTKETSPNTQRTNEISK